MPVMYQAIETTKMEETIVQDQCQSFHSVKDVARVTTSKLDYKATHNLT